MTRSHGGHEERGSGPVVVDDEVAAHGQPRVQHLQRLHRAVRENTPQHNTPTQTWLYDVMQGVPDGKWRANRGQTGATQGPHRG